MNVVQSESTAQNAIQQRIASVFDRMSRQIGQVAKNAKASHVHKFRTYSRRIEALVGDLTPETGNKRKLIKNLSKLRKKAGKIRDLDVQIDFLNELKVPDRQDHRAQLLEALKAEQEQRSRKFSKSFSADEVKDLRRRLRKARSEVDTSVNDPLKLAFAHLPKLGGMPMTEKNLHACRIAAKHARYLAEIVPNSLVATQFVEELRSAQDEIGGWHDILKLSERAERMFGAARDSSLVAALQNLSRARFRRASNSLVNALHSIAQLEQPKPSRGKLPAPAAHAPGLAVA